MSIQQLLNPLSVDNRALRLNSYAQTVRELNLDVVGGPLNMTPAGIGGVGQFLASDGLGNVVWAGIAAPVSNKIESTDATSSITCNDIGIGGASMTSVGNLDMTGGYLRNAGLIDTVGATLNIITPTTDLQQGNSEIKLKTDSLDRLIMDDATTILRTKNYVYSVGGATIGLYDANGAVQIAAGNLNRPSISMNELGIRISSLDQKFQREMTDIRDAAQVYSAIMLSQIYRDEITETYQAFRDDYGAVQLQIDATGVKVSNAYTLPTADGISGASLQTNGAGACSFVSPPPLFSSYGRVIVSGVARQTLCSASILGSLTIPANAFALGSVWKLQASGTYNVVPAQTVVLSILMNGVAVAITPTLAIANTPAPWSSSWVLTVRAVGAAGIARLVAGSANRLDSVVVCSSTVETANFNTTIANVMDFTSTMSAIGDTITCESVSFSRVI